MFSHPILIPTMATNSSTPSSLPATTPSAAQPRPLRREGAMIFLSSEEQALEEAMLRSSPEPEASALGKRTRGDDDEAHDGTDMEPDSEIPPALQNVAPTLSNVTAASLRYATQKRIRSEQRGELDAFLLASTSLQCHLTCGSQTPLFRTRRWADKREYLSAFFLSKTKSRLSNQPPHLIRFQKSSRYVSWSYPSGLISHRYDCTDQYKQLCCSSAAICRNKRVQRRYTSQSHPSMHVVFDLYVF